jgi:hypothetical protein
VLSVDVRFVPWLVEGHSTNSELKLCLHIDVQYVSTVPNLVDAPFVHATQGLPAGDLLAAILHHGWHTCSAIKTDMSAT